MNRSTTATTVVVAGLGPAGQAVAQSLRRRGARVVALDIGGAGLDSEQMARLRGAGVEVRSTGAGWDGPLDLVVVDPSVSMGEEPVHGWIERGVEVIGELEWAYREARCLSLAIAGTNGKSSAASLLTRVLEQGGRRVGRGGDRLAPLSAMVEGSRDLEYLVVEVESGQLEGLEHFRPAVGILLNLGPDRSGRCWLTGHLALAMGRLFRRQQSFDWAIVQSEALAQLRGSGVELPSKVITFSANNPRADLWMDRGLLLSRLPGWVGPLLDLDRCRVRGSHFAENLMAVLAAGHVLRIPLDDMARVLSSCEPQPGCYELLGQRRGAWFVNDGCGSNLETLRPALQAMPPGQGGEPNVWLIAGGADDGQEFHDVGPVLARRVKRAFVFGPASERMRAAWSLFTPCTAVGSLLEAVQSAADMATRGDVVLFSPACPSVGSPSSSQLRGEAFRQAVRQVAPDLVWAGGSGRSDDPIGTER
jgi:UDP-N-acetylmuramoylalanine--D-glutamate ligase